MTTTTMDAPTTMGATAAAATTYEYRSVTAPLSRLGFVSDTYDSFGWMPDGTRTVTSPTGETTISLKRDRHIKNRAMVTELQAKAESALANIVHLEASKTRKAAIVALTFGVLGAAAMAGSVFTFLAGAWLPFVALGFVGLVCWALAFPAYRRTRARTVAAVTPAIDRQYDTLYAACEQARGLIA